jgi:hypothetical protein
MYKLIIVLLLPFSASFAQSIAGGNNSGSIVSDNFSSSVGEIYVVPSNPDMQSSGTTAVATQIIFEALSTNDYIVAEGVTYYPNPVKDYLTFEAGKQLSLTNAQLNDAKGAKVNFPAFKENTVDLSSLSAGIYFMTFPGSNIKPIKIVKN